MTGFKLGKGWRKWPMIVFIIALIALAILAFATGCSSGDTPATSPIAQLQTNVSALNTRLDTIDDTIWADHNDVTGLKTQMTNANSNLTGYGERIANLEAQNCSCNTTATCDLTAINASLTMLGLRIQVIESLNLSSRLLALEARPVCSPTPTPNASATPTPTPTPITNHAPTIISLIATPLGSTNQSWIVACTANDSDGDAISYIWAATGGTIFPLAGNASTLWTFSAFGIYSIVAQVNDGRGGYDIEIASVNYPSP